MRRHLESDLGILFLDRNSMALARKAQALYHRKGKGIAEIARELDVSPEDAARAVAYSTHFLSADNLEDADSSKDKGDAFDILHEWMFINVHKDAAAPQVGGQGQWAGDQSVQRGAFPHSRLNPAHGPADHGDTPVVGPGDGAAARDHRVVIFLTVQRVGNHRRRTILRPQQIATINSFWSLPQAAVSIMREC